MKKQLKIKLLPNGEIQMITKGLKGKTCLKYAEFLEKLADAKIVAQEFTPEYYQKETENEFSQEGQQLYE